MTTCWLESIWTRTLSTTISINGSAMGGLSHPASPGGGVRAGTERPHGEPDGHSEDETTDVREERNPTAGRRRAQGGDPVEELEDEPEAQYDDGRHAHELVEKAEEDDRLDPGRRVEHEVGPQRRGDGA